MGGAMKNRLCIQCRRWMENEYGNMEPEEPWEHCHHELEELIEPGEKDYPEKQGEDARDAYKRICDKMNKPEEPCWCQSENWRKYIMNEFKWIDIKWIVYYCPLCGRKL